MLVREAHTFPDVKKSICSISSPRKWNTNTDEREIKHQVFRTNYWFLLNLNYLFHFVESIIRFLSFSFPLHSRFLLTSQNKLFSVSICSSQIFIDWFRRFQRPSAIHLATMLTCQKLEEKGKFFYFCIQISANNRLIESTATLNRAIITFEAEKYTSHKIQDTNFTGNHSEAKMLKIASWPFAKKRSIVNCLMSSYFST
jgi:hypothetical protein